MSKRIVFVVALSLWPLILAAPTVQAVGKVQVMWLGHAAFKLTSVDGKVILIDPFITKNPKTPARFKNLDELGRIDLIFLRDG